ncbi:CPBP family intramembrane glutamic endopeptidase [Ruminococcus flavefaciens]|uniref:CPBP family intramembrane glutamic endopeptidase n=1 Tax=Ruminococcus flavefaciens TaxID=1265 RepID=UPI00048ED69C|nr:type II CAAX endopeptidase family protein [Ruminococcus flavefaciens]
MSKGKIRKHRLSRNKSLPAVVVVTLLMMFGYFYMAQIVLGCGLSIPMVILFSNRTVEEIFDDGPLVETAAMTGAIFASIILLFFYYHWFKPEYKWKPRRTSLSWKLISPIMIYWFVFFGIAYTVVSGNFTFGIPTYNAVIFTVGAGVCEEISFRAIGISYMKRQLKGEKHILPILLFTSISFGLIHIANAIMDGRVGIHAMQAVLASMLGIFFGAVYIRTGNIIPCIIAHGLHDFFVSAFEVNKHAELPVSAMVISAICEALLAVWGLYLIRKAKRPEIEALWNEKWQIPELSETENNTAEQL